VKVFALLLSFAARGAAATDPAPPVDKVEEVSRSLIVLDNAHEKEQAVTAAVHIVSNVRSTTPEALKAEIVAAEAALAMRAEVGGAPVVYDSPSVSISLRKVTADALVESGADLETIDGAGIKIPADPRIKGKHGGPVTISVTSYHTGDNFKELPTARYGKNRKMRRMSGPDSISGTTQEEDRVDFFMSKTSVSWRGTVDVKVPGLSASVPAHERKWNPIGSDNADSLYSEEKAEVAREFEAVAALSGAERARGLRRLARRWHPDKNPEDHARATEVFSFLQDLRETLA